MAAFVSMVVGTVLSKYIWEFAPPLAAVGTAVADVLAVVGVRLSSQQSGAIVVVVGLSFVWGVVYHLARQSGEGDDSHGSHEREW